MEYHFQRCPNLFLGCMTCIHMGSLFWGQTTWMFNVQSLQKICRTTDSALFYPRSIYENDQSDKVHNKDLWFRPSYFCLISSFNKWCYFPKGNPACRNLYDMWCFFSLELYKQIQLRVDGVQDETDKHVVFSWCVNSGQDNGCYFVGKLCCCLWRISYCIWWQPSQPNTLNDFKRGFDHCWWELWIVRWTDPLFFFDFPISWLHVNTLIFFAV